MAKFPLKLSKIELFCPNIVNFPGSSAPHPTPYAATPLQALALWTSIPPKKF